MPCSCFNASVCVCLPFPDQRVASFCALTDMHPEQDLDGAQELPLCVDPGSGKDFMDPAGYVSPVVCLLPMSQAPAINRNSAQSSQETVSPVST